MSMTITNYERVKCDDCFLGIARVPACMGIKRVQCTTCKGKGLILVPEGTTFADYKAARARHGE